MYLSIVAGVLVAAFIPSQVQATDTNKATHDVLGAYCPTISRFTSCIPPPYGPYSPVCPENS